MGTLRLGLLCTPYLLVGNISAQVLNYTQSYDIQKNSQTLSTKPTSVSNSLIINQIQELRKKGELSAAQEQASNYLKSYAHDVDVRLLLGLIQLQLQHYELAESNLKTVLNTYPHYLEARIGLIQLKINEKKYAEARFLAQQGLTLNPRHRELFSLEKKIDYLEQGQENPARIAAENRLKSPINDKLYSNANSVKAKRKKSKTKTKANPRKSFLLQAKQLAGEGKYQQEYFLLLKTIQTNSFAIEPRLALADYYLAHHAELSALKVVSDGLKKIPNNSALLLKNAEIQMTLGQLPQASSALKKALISASENKRAKAYLAEISDINPPYTYGVNEIGIFTDNAYVADLHAVWDYTTLYYSRDIDSGRIGGRVNYASRQGLDAPQFELDYALRVSPNLYFDFAGALANQSALFPDRMARGEAYYRITRAWELSVGGQYSRVASTYFSTYTSSVNLYLGNYWLSFRPYYFVPKTQDTSLLYTGTIRRYFATLDHFIGLNFGSGTSPDIADLLTVNFIIIKNSFINANYEFPILNHRLVVDVGAGYQRWKYPSTLIRNLYDAKLGIKYRF